MRALDMLGLACGNLGRARLRTALTAAGVAIGTAAVVTLVAFSAGAEGLAVRNAATFNSVTQVQVLPDLTDARGRPTGPVHVLTPASVRAIRRVPHVAAVTAYLPTPPLRLTVGRQSVDLAARAQSPLASGVTLVAGRDTAAAEADGILVPASVARRLGPSSATLVGRAVILTAGGGVCCRSGPDDVVALGPDRPVAARIAGVYDDSGGPTPRLLVPVALGAVIDGRVQGVSGGLYLERLGYALLVVQTDDARQTAGVAARIAALQYLVQDRADLLARVQFLFALLRGGLAAIGGIALLVAAIGIANTLIMTILERTREIGIMMALGTEPGAIRRLFLVETALVGLLGGLAGVALAALGSVAGNVIFGRWLRTQGGSGLGGALFVLSPGLVVGAAVLAVGVSLLAGALPSRRAMRLHPLDALRHE